MQLSDLFVSHKQVEPVSFTTKTPSLPQPIYLNRERAQTVTSETKPEEDTSTWKAEEPLNWKVANSDVVTTPQEPKPSGVTAKSGTTPSTKPWVNPYKGNKNKWISDITAAYKKAGLNDNAIKNLLAKNALESGYGTHAQGDFNYGNITTGNNWSGRYVQGRDSNANGQAIKQQFRAYNSLDDFVKDEIQFLTSLYDFNQDDNFDTFVGKLQGDNKGGRKYAEATSYKEALRGVYNSIYG
jgi:flagellum-specific peptidoglycan hydrolase FlgJ